MVEKKETGETARPALDSENILPAAYSSDSTVSDGGSIIWVGKVPYRMRTTTVRDRGNFVTDDGSSVVIEGKVVGVGYEPEDLD